jgi:hypothetical protein
MQVDAEHRRSYEGAYRAWQQQLDALHRVLLDGEQMEPPQLKGLLNREARTKARYDAEREALLGLDTTPDDDPFGD